MYGTVHEANTYFEGRFNAEQWDNASLQQKTKALVTATNDIDNLNFIGSKFDPEQTSEWPRRNVNNNLTPRAIEWATYEIALAYLEGKTPEGEFDQSRIQALSAMSARVQYDGKSENAVAGIISVKAWRLLLPWLVNPQNLETVRT